MVGALADLLEAALQQPALTGADQPALEAAVTKTLSSFVVMNATTRAGNKYKHVDTVYNTLMPKVHKPGATAAEMLAGMATSIVEKVMKSSPAV